MKSVLIISQRKKYLATARIPEFLHKYGLAVTALSTPDSYILYSKAVSNKYIFHNQLQLRQMLITIVSKNNFDFIIPGDEVSIHYFKQLLDSRNIIFPGIKKLQSLILKSCGTRESFSLLGEKSKLLSLAGELGILIPENYRINTLDEALSKASLMKRPLVLKTDGGSGGSDVLVCRNKDISNEYRTVTKNNTTLLNFKRRITNRIKIFFQLPILNELHKLSIQEFIEGKNCIHNIFAVNGQVKASNTFLTLEQYPAGTGPGTVVELINNVQIEDGAKMIIERTGYTGFASFDFIIDHSGKAYLLECNVRPTPTTHLGEYVGFNLIHAFSNYLHGKADMISESNGVEKIIALFPNEQVRDSQSKYIRENFHDIPENDSELKDFLLVNY